MWSIFDKIYCINLVTRDDRYHSCQDLFDKLGMDVEFFRTERHPNGGCEGCYRSHMSCIKKAYDSGAQNCLILEDDIIVNPKVDQAKMLDVAKAYMDKHSDWDIFYLGSSPSVIHSHSKVGKSVRKGPCFHTHAYVINRPFMEKVLKYDYPEIPIDHFYVKLAAKGDLKSYRLYPSIFNQGDFGSDIETSGSPFSHTVANTMRKMGESYTYYVGVPAQVLVILLIVVLLIICILLWVAYKKNYIKVPARFYKYNFFAS